MCRRADTLLKYSDDREHRSGVGPGLLFTLVILWSNYLAKNVYVVKQFTLVIGSTL